jgi:hypothetical protein
MLKFQRKITGPVGVGEHPDRIEIHPFFLIFGEIPEVNASRNLNLKAMIFQQLNSLFNITRLEIIKHDNLYKTFTSFMTERISSNVLTSISNFVCPPEGGFFQLKEYLSIEPTASM